MRVKEPTIYGMLIIYIFCLLIDFAQHSQSYSKTDTHIHTQMHTIRSYRCHRYHDVMLHSHTRTHRNDMLSEWARSTNERTNERTDVITHKLSICSNKYTTISPHAAVLLLLLSLSLSTFRFQFLNLIKTHALWSKCILICRAQLKITIWSVQFTTNFLRVSPKKLKLLQKIVKLFASCSVFRTKHLSPKWVKLTSFYLKTFFN